MFKRKFNVSWKVLVKKIDSKITNVGDCKPTPARSPELSVLHNLVVLCWFAQLERIASSLWTHFEHCLFNFILNTNFKNASQRTTITITITINQDEATMAKSLCSSVDNPLDRLSSRFLDLMLDSLDLDSRIWFEDAGIDSVGLMFENQVWFEYVDSECQTFWLQV